MNPHFIFNSLNSIQNYILKNEKEKANDYLLEFSKLIRIILENSDSTSILLSNEISTLELYVGLEKKRVRNEFKYTVEIDPIINLQECTIPSLLIQPYVENSIWHGKVYDNPEGEIKIIITKENDLLFFEIIDNGMGIKQAEKFKINKQAHTSLGSTVTKKRIDLLSDLNHELSEVKISEAFADQNLSKFVGTKVTFSIPYKTAK
jgi:LytS/YehU family sensor histidine kinase